MKSCTVLHSKSTDCGARDKNNLKQVTSMPKRIPISYRRKLGGAFALMVLLVIVHSAMVWFSLHEMVLQTHQLHAVWDTEGTISEVQLAEKDFILTGDKRHADVVQAKTIAAQQHLERLKETTTLSPQAADILIALHRYETLFLRYVHYEDQHQALISERHRLNRELLYALDQLQQNAPAWSSEIGQLYRLLAERHETTDTDGANEKTSRTIISVCERLQSLATSPATRFSLYQLQSRAENLLLVQDKLSATRQEQLSQQIQLTATLDSIRHTAAATTTQQRHVMEQQKLRTTDAQVLFFIVSSVLAILATAYLYTRMIRPLKSLLAATEAISLGHFEERMEEAQEPEFQQVAANFNLMARHIQQLNSSLEGKVTERTAQLALEKSRFENLFANNPDSIAVLDAQHSIIDVNPAFTTLFGYAPAEIRGHNIETLLLDEKDRNSPSRSIVHNLHSGTIARLEGLRRRKDGSYLTVEIVAYTFSPKLAAEFVYLIYRDISDRRAAEERMHYLSFHDSLTGLKNRTFFEQEITRLNGIGIQCGLIVCDVDCLKIINDTLGHAVGDDLLRTTAAILQQAAQPDYDAVRIGGDEFIILLPAAGEPEIAVVVQSIQAHLEEVNHRRQVPILLSIGWACRTEASEAMHEVFRQADNQMYENKARRRKERITACPPPLCPAPHPADN